MRTKIAQCTGKTQLKSSVCGLLIGALSLPASACAADWTPTYGAVTYTRSTVAGFFVYMEPTAATNINTCAGHNAAEPIFHIVYPSNVPSEAQKVMISQISLAVALGKPIKIYSAACNTTSKLNTVNEILLDAN